MSDHAPSVDPNNRFNWLEYPHDDFPFYEDRPVRISILQWLFVMGMVAFGFLVLVSPIPFLTGILGQFARAILFFAISLGGLAMVASGHWNAIFRRVGFRDLAWMIAFAFLNLVVSSCVGSLSLISSGRKGTVL